ncbi:hypothetical protein CSUB01_11900 [Colletotrichum sublineola]|uniref:Uncharacterized protein n=1 Tax=Colletotrichum sublineola TaxID=1173701 RepID=A0A066WWJ1_COLSU|nr:hypothetical protein CSUB01_11900 [Colletotrichum sublineola]
MGTQKRSANKGFAFVITDTSGKPNSEDRKLIRSHVMRGKNRRVSDEKAKRASARVAENDPDTPQEMSQVYHVPNDLYMVQFAEEVDAASRAMVFEYTAVYGVIKEIMYPVEWCLRFDDSKTSWFYWLLSDAAFLHSILFTVGMLHDSVGGETSQRTSFHVWRTLNLLNRHISDKSLALADSTIATVVSMCMAYETFGQRASAAAHVRGLRRIVELRGGVESFRHNLQLQVKICRDISWESAFTPILGDPPTRFKHDQHLSDIRLFIDSIDRRMSNVFQDLHDFSRLANFLVKTGRKIDPNVFQNLMTSIQYRLLYLEPIEQSSVSETFRLGMISYIATLFLKVQGAKITLTFLTDQLRSHCQKLHVSELSTTTVRLMFVWTLVVGAISVFEECDDLWLLPKLASLRDSLGPTWPEAKASLKKVMWMELVHSPDGIKVFQKLVLHVAKRRASRSLNSDGCQKCSVASFPFHIIQYNHPKQNYHDPACVIPGFGAPRQLWFGKALAANLCANNRTAAWEHFRIRWAQSSKHSIRNGNTRGVDGIPRVSTLGIDNRPAWFKCTAAAKHLTEVSAVVALHSVRQGLRRTPDVLQREHEATTSGHHPTPNRGRSLCWHARNIPFGIRSGGHDLTAAQAQGRDGVISDLRTMDSIFLAEDKKSARIGGWTLSIKLSRRASWPGCLDSPPQRPAGDVLTKLGEFERELPINFTGKATHLALPGVGPVLAWLFAWTSEDDNVYDGWGVSGKDESSRYTDIEHGLHRYASFVACNSGWGRVRLTNLLVVDDYTVFNTIPLPANTHWHSRVRTFEYCTLEVARACYPLRTKHRIAAISAGIVDATAQATEYEEYKKWADDLSKQRHALPLRVPQSESSEEDMD